MIEITALVWSALAATPPTTDLICPKDFRVQERPYGESARRKICLGAGKGSEALPEKIIRRNRLWMERGAMKGGGTYSRIWSERGDLISNLEESASASGCAAGKDFPEGDIFVGYSKDQTFYPLARTERDKLVLFGRIKMSGDQPLFGLGDHKAPVKWSTPQFDEQFGACVHSGKLVEKTLDYSPLGNRPGLLRKPSEKESVRFARAYSNCVEHGDYEPGDPRGCVRKDLKAVSDLNKDGILEFWYRAPFRWDLGFGMVEYDAKTDRFFAFGENCEFCGD